MPDIEIKCKTCSEVTTVSEYADANSITCGKCGLKLSKPTAGLQLKQRPTVRRQAVPHPEPQAPQPSTPPSTLRVDPNSTVESGAVQTSSKTTTFRKAKMTHHIISWALFLFLALLLGWIRYGDALTKPNLDLFTQYGPFAMITIHITIFLLVCKESVFSGILCLIVPFYGLYYVFFVSDGFILRALVAGALIGIGQDSFFFFKDFIVVAFERANQWIRYGAMH